MKIGNATIGIECGQHWWRPSSWTRKNWKGETVGWWRTFPSGIAFGPIMVWATNYSYKDKISELTDVVIRRESEAALLAEVLDRVGVKPANGQDVRSWAQDRVAAMVSGEFSSVDEALADWNVRERPVHWVKRNGPLTTAELQQAEDDAGAVEWKPIHQREAETGR